jgi:hypothetical protein
MTARLNVAYDGLPGKPAIQWRKPRDFLGGKDPAQLTCPILEGEEL